MADRQQVDRGPVQVVGEVLSSKQAGDYVYLTVVADAVAQRARPGNFITVGVGGVGGQTSASLLRRPFWLHRARTSGGYGGTVELVFAARGPATRWLAGLRPRDQLSLTGPLGRPFSLPTQPAVCVLVGDGHGAAPLFGLAERLRERGCTVHMVLGGDTSNALVAPLEARRASSSVVVATADGSAGAHRAVADALSTLLRKEDVDVVYAAGPLATLRAVAQRARAHGAWCQVAVEVPMPCGVGLCAGCMFALRAPDGSSTVVRCCTEGPVVDGAAVAWSTLLGPDRQELS